MYYIPEEIVDIIADFHDYEKYCKPKHSKNLNHVLNDIVDMGKIMETIQPRIAKECWGKQVFENWLELWNNGMN
tara:strand:+ start:109 stop:330 length:222 start_codon:yes stop_codon:yes gene_type:complete